MKVKQLIALLEECDPQGEVLGWEQPTAWPFEYKIDGVCQREWVATPCVACDRDQSAHYVGANPEEVCGEYQRRSGGRGPAGDDEEAPTDVLLVLGRQLRASKDVLECMVSR